MYGDIFWTIHTRCLYKVWLAIREGSRLVLCTRVVNSMLCADFILSACTLPSSIQSWYDILCRLMLLDINTLYKRTYVCTYIILRYSSWLVNSIVYLYCIYVHVLRFLGTNLGKIFVNVWGVFYLVATLLSRL